MPNNIGAFGENFPYSNQHDMNMDWIIKIAKDFLDQYTQIQSIITNGQTSLQNEITNGLTELQEKAEEVEELLQEWYNTHSSDIANQLQTALAELISATNIQKENIATYTAELITSLPEDYTEALAEIGLISSAFDKYVGGRKLFSPIMIYDTEGRLNNSGLIYETSGFKTSLFIPVEPEHTYYCNFTISTNEPVCYYSNNNESSFIQRITSGTQFTTPNNCNFIRFSMENSHLNYNNITTDELLKRFEDRTIEEVNALFNISGYSSIAPLNMEILDDETPVEYSSNIVFTTNRVNINGQIAIDNSREYRLYYIIKLKSSSIPTGISINGIYSNGSKISTNIFSSYVLQNSYVWMGYLDVDSATVDTAELAISITTATAPTITIEKFELLTNELTSNIEYLEVGTGKTFASFTSAFTYAKQHPLTNYVVRLFGWYEMNGTTDDLTTDSSGQGLAVPYNVIKIIGNDRRDTNVINFNGTNAQAPFYLLHSVDIENIYFITRGKYSLLIDDGRNAEQTFNIKGNKFKHISGGSGAIGIGMHNCEINIFENYFEQSTDAGVRAHNWDYGNSINQHLNIYGNYFTDNMLYAVHLYTVNRQDGMGYARAIINENYFSTRTIILTEEDTSLYGEGNLWEVWGHNNSQTSVEIIHHDEGNHSGLVNIFMPTAPVTDTKV